MRIGEGFSVGITAMRLNKMRTLLTMLGIIIGVAAVLAMIAIGDGAKTIVLEDAEKLGGVNMFSMYRTGHIRKGNRWVRNRSSEYFKYEDALAIEAECPSVDVAVPQIPMWRGVLIQAAGGAEKRGGYYGVDHNYGVAMKWDVTQGRFLTEGDVTNSATVCVLGADVADELFFGDTPLGKEVKIARGAGRSRWSEGRGDGERSTERFVVVGVLERRGASLRFGWNRDEMVFIPITTVQERFTGNDQVAMLGVRANSTDLVEKAMAEVSATMRKHHRNQDDFFQIRSMKEGMEQMTRISKVIKLTLGIIAGFSLLVGGIGIMNMMLVSVTERTREIGLRKAIGAKRADILFQFLVEAVVMCSVGGLLGIALGVGAGYGMGHVATQIVKVVDHWPSVVSVEWMIISVTFSAAIGIFFGLYPAIKAAQLSPIEALRTE